MSSSPPPAPPVTAEQAHRVLVLLCLALAGGVVVMAGVSLILVTSGAFPPFLGYPGSVRLGVGTFLLLLLGASYPVYRSAGGPDRSGDDPHAALTAFQTRVITSMALREFVGIAGGLLILLSGDLVLGGTLAALSVATILLALPTREDVRAVLRDPASGGP